MRMRVAASMLRHGHDPHAVAEATAVPLALVDLISEQLDTHPATSPHHRPPTPHLTTARETTSSALTHIRQPHPLTRSELPALPNGTPAGGPSSPWRP